jgi:hypothetical protein
MLAAALAASGCVGSGLDTAQTGTPDRSIVTSSIPASHPAAETDPATIGHAVVAADLGREADQGIPWANPATGSAGVISDIEEVEAAGRTCRRFETSRHSYEGIALFVGETCRAPGRNWQIVSFGPKTPLRDGHDTSEG